VLQFQREILQAPGDVQSPRPVAEVPLDLAADGDDGEGGERSALRIESVDGVDQADPRDLLQVVERLSASAVPIRHPIGEGQAVTDQVVAQPATSLLGGKHPLARIGDCRGV
jgi:hypothetical protein